MPGFTLRRSTILKCAGKPEAKDQSGVHAEDLRQKRTKIRTLIQDHRRIVTGKEHRATPVRFSRRV